MKGEDKRAPSRIGLSIIIFIIALVGGFALSHWMWDVARSQCPSDTFASGKVHFSWDMFAWVVFSLALFYLLRGLVERIWPPAAKDPASSQWYWGAKSTIAILFISVASGAALWFTAFTPVCLAESGIYHRTAPWRAFQRHAWTDVTRVNVDCRNRRRSPDLYYVLTMKDGTKLDVGDALGGRTFDAFRARLANVPVTFTANIHPSCPEWYSDWAGEKP